MLEWQLERDPRGGLILTSADGVAHHGVIAVRAFPVSAPGVGVALLNGEGSELAWIESPAALPDEIRALVEAELAAREFLPEILCIREVSGFVTPCTWEVETDRGTTRFVLKGQEDIRRLGTVALLISDKHGVPYLLRDPERLDKRSRRFVDRFL